jgi:phosphoribosylglycinamide formyltransferase 1
VAELSIAVFASGGGTNLQALIDASKAGVFFGKVKVVISNNSAAFALTRAKRENIPACHVSSKTCPDPKQLVERLQAILQERDVSLIVLAGYMKLLPLEIIRLYRSRIINIHPALLPKYGGQGMYGLNVHKAVLESGDRLSGATVHFVDEAYDRGPILIQRTAPVLPNDTPETLASRVLEIEHKILPLAVGIFS